MKRSKYLLCGLLLVLYAGFALSVVNMYEPNITCKQLESADPSYPAIDNEIGLKLQKFTQDTLDFNDQEADAVPESINPDLWYTDDLINYDDDDDDDSNDDETSDDDDDDDDDDSDDESDEEYTKEQAEAKIEEAENKVEEVETKISEARAQEGYDAEAIEDTEDKLEDAQQKLEDAKEALSKDDYKAAYEKAEDCIEECESALDTLEDGKDNGAKDDEDNNTENGDNTEDESPDQEKIVVTVPEVIQAIETPQMIAFSAIGAIAVSSTIMLTNKRFALKFATSIFKIGEVFFAVNAVAYKIGGTLFVAIGTVLRPPSIRNIRREEVLTNDTREQIYEYIQDHEGAHFREIISHVEIGPFAGVWHLQVLEDFRFITSRRYRHYKVYYLAGKKIPEKDPRLVLKNETTKAVFRFISENPGTYQNEIAKELGKAHGTIRYNLKKLIKANIINTEKDNGRRKFFINEEFLNSIRDLT